MSNLSLERLLFDAAAPTDGPLIGSYLLGAGGTVLTETGTALDVNIVNASLVVTATDLDIRNLLSSQDSVEIKTAAGQALAIDGSGFITANINGTVSTSIATDADDAASVLNPIFVGGISANQASALGTVSAAGDRTAFTTDLYRRLFINDAPNIAVASASVTCGLTEVALPQLAGRTRVMLQNKSDKSIFVGPTGVTTSSGLEIAKGGTLSLEAGQAIALYAISTAASKQLICFELA